MKFDRVCILQASIPKSYYNVPADRCSFILHENDEYAVVSLTAGNYSRSTLRLALQDALNGASPNGLTYTVSYNASNLVDTGKYNFGCAEGMGYYVAFQFERDMFEQLGFDPNSTNMFTGTLLTSTNVINLARENTIRIHSDIFTGYNDDILQMVYSSEDPTFSYVNFTQYDIQNNSQPFAGSNNGKFRFFITDEDNIKLDTNGLNINFDLLLFESDALMAKNHYASQNKLLRGLVALSATG